MKLSLRHISFLPLAVILFFFSCKETENNLIPRNKLAMIYAEMLMTDQWITDNPDIRSLADTSLIYEPILEKYGYNSEDYRYSVNVYLDDPERFSRIFRTTSEMLDERHSELKKQKNILDAERRMAERRELYAVNFVAGDYFPYMADKPYVQYYDSLTVEYDTLAAAMILRPVEIKDTIYDRIEMIIRVDSMAVADSLAAKDSLDIKEKSVEIDTAALRKVEVVPAGKVPVMPDGVKRMDQAHKKQLGSRNLQKLKELKTIK